MSNEEQAPSSTRPGKAAVLALRHQDAYAPHDILCVCTGAVSWGRAQARVLNDEQFKWSHWYDSSLATRQGPLGPGVRHRFENELEFCDDHLRFTEFDGGTVDFSCDEEGDFSQRKLGYVLHQYSPTDFLVESSRSDCYYIFVQSPLDDKKLLLARVVTPYERCIDLYYDRDDRLTTVFVDDHDVTLNLAYNAQGKLASVIKRVDDEAPIELLYYAYDDLGQIDYFDNPYGGRTHLKFTKGRICEFIDPEGYQRSWSYDDQGRCIRCDSEDGLSSLQATYSPGSTCVRYGDGGEWNYRFNQDQVITQIEDPMGGIKRFELSESGRILAEIDPVGRKSTWNYDEDGAHTDRTNYHQVKVPPARESIEPSAERHIKLSRNMLDAYCSNFTKDAEHEPRSIEQIAARVPAELHAVLDKGIGDLMVPPATPVYEYNNAGQLIRSIDKQGIERQRNYDKRGICNYTVCPTATRGFFRKTSWGLDEEIEGELLSPRRYAYAPSHDRAALAQMTDEIGLQTRYVRNLCGEVSEILQNGELDVRYEHDLVQRVTRTFDAQNNLAVRYEYDDKNNQYQRIQSSGEVHHYKQGTDGLNTQISLNDYDVQLRYDDDHAVVLDKRDGRGVEVRCSQGAKVREHILLDRFKTTYTLDGEKLHITTPNGRGCSVERITPRTLKIACPNDLQVLSHYSYRGSMLSQMAWTQAPAPRAIWDARYQYSNCNELKKIDDSLHGITDLSYDLCHRLIKLSPAAGSEIEIAYDDAGNLTRNAHFRELQVDIKSRLLRADADRFRYDHDGRLIEHQSPNLRRHYRYNSIHRLVGASFDDGRPEWSACYDGHARIMFTQVGEERTEYFWHDSRLAAKIDPRGQVRIFIYAAELARIPIMFLDYPSLDASHESAKLYKVLSDQSGMPRLILDEKNDICWHTKSTAPYGGINIHDPLSLNYEIRWPGQLWDAHTDLVINRFRTYDPRLGRYLQPNPSGYSTRENHYAYSDNPLATLDLTGS